MEILPTIYEETETESFNETENIEMEHFEKNLENQKKEEPTNENKEQQNESTQNEGNKKIFSFPINNIVSIFKNFFRLDL
jgi:hypothetical protein